MNWQLHYHRTVVQYLVSLRESGHDLRMAIFSLQNSKDGIPEKDVTLIDQGIYEWQVEGHMVTCEVIPAKKQISVSSVVLVKASEDNGENEEEELDM